MPRNLLAAIWIGALALPLAACSEPQDTVSAEQTFGPSPALPEPEHSWIPTVNVATATGWSDGGKPVAAEGMAVNAFATGLDHPRNVYVLPNGDVLVAETNAPPKPDANRGLRGLITRWIMNSAGAGGPSAHRLVLLRDTHGDCVADVRSVFLEGLHSPYGIALIGDQLFIADTDAIRRYPYRTGQTHIDEPASVLTELPAGPINRHWTKNLVASPDGRSLYVSIGSNSNVGENGMAAEEGRAQIWEVDVRTGA